MLNDRLILRGADGYDEARFARIFNARRPERYPAAVLIAESEDDIVEGVRLALDRGWKVAIRAGGHSFPVWSVRDGVLLIDLGAFKETAFDESTGIVSVTPAVTCGELNAYLSGYGRFFTTGDCPSLGLGGFLLQGGIGIGFRGWGYAAEQIAAIDVVTADGNWSGRTSRTTPIYSGRHAARVRAFAEPLRDSTSRPAPFQRGWPQRRISIP